MKINDDFKLPGKMTISGRSSSMTAAFVSSIMPMLKPKKEEIKECLEVLGLDEKDIRCVYCGEKASDWDHFRPLVLDKRPTGYISEIKNLVPSCGKCNQSKRNLPWKEFMEKKESGLIIQSEIDSHHERTRRLEHYEDWGKVLKIDFEQLVDKARRDRYWEMCDNLHNEMKRCQSLADEISTIIREKLGK
jgi:hypothetical protein